MESGQMNDDTTELKTRLIEILKLRSDASVSDILKLVRKLVAERGKETRLKEYMKATNQPRELAERSLAERDAAEAQTAKRPV